MKRLSGKLVSSFSRLHDFPLISKFSEYTLKLSSAASQGIDGFTDSVEFMFRGEILHVIENSFLYVSGHRVYGYDFSEFAGK